MNHKYSTFLLLFLMFGFLVWNVLGELTSDEIDDVCAVNGSVLYKYNGTWGCGNFLDSNVFNFTINNITNIYNNYSLYSNQSLYWGNYLYTNYNLSQLGIVFNPFDQVLNTTSNVNFNNITNADTIKTGRVISNVTFNSGVSGYSKNKGKITINAGGTNSIINVYGDSQEIQIDNTGITSGVSGYFADVRALKNGVVDPITINGILSRVNTENASNTSFISGSISIHGINDGNRSTGVLGAEFIGKNLGSGQGYGFYGYGQSGYLLASANTLTATGIEGFCQQSSGLCVGLRASPFTANSKGFSIYNSGNVHMNNGNIYIYNSTALQEAQNMSLVTAQSKGSLWVQGYAEFNSTAQFNTPIKITATTGNPCGTSQEGSIYYNISTHTFYGCNSTDWRALY